MSYTVPGALTLRFWTHFRKLSAKNTRKSPLTLRLA